MDISYGALGEVINTMLFKELTGHRTSFGELQFYRTK
jgi:hypothetical protein